MSFRIIFSCFLAPVVAVAVSAVAADARASNVTGTVFGGTMGGSLSRAGDGMRGNSSPDRVGEGSQERGVSGEPLEVARCPYARPSARSGRSGPAVRTKPSKIFKVPAEDAATGAQDNAKRNSRGGSYDENGNFRSDDRVRRDAAAGETVGTADDSVAAPASPASWASAASDRRAADVARSTLPCQPQVIDDGRTTWYVCGKTYYQLAYGADGPIYTPITAP